MTENSNTTPLRDAEARMLLTAAPSLAVGAFGALVSALEGLIDAERDLGGWEGGDPAVAAWPEAVERAEEAVHGWIAVLQKAPRRGPGDGRLQIVGRVIGEVMRCEEAGDLAHFMRLVGPGRTLFHMPGHVPAAGWVNGVIDAALDRLQLCVAMTERPRWPAEESGSLPLAGTQGPDPEGGLSPIC